MRHQWDVTWHKCMSCGQTPSTAALNSTCPGPPLAQAPAPTAPAPTPRQHVHSYGANGMYDECDNCGVDYKNIRYVADPCGTHSWHVYRPTLGGKDFCIRCGDMVPMGHARSLLGCTGTKAPALTPAQQALLYPTPSFQATYDEMRQKVGQILEEYKPRRSAPEKPKCASCCVELSSYLDVYYGTDSFKAKQCVKCRGRKS